jgi:simple sugar transport system ATP-binding protein
LSEPILQLLDISKEYYGNKVLKNVSLTVHPGEVHALVGENGAGKSTLMNILFGMPVIHSTGGFSGQIIFGGEQASINSPKDAMEKGIGMVHQEFMLLPGFTITENLKLNREITKHNVVSKLLGEKLKSLDMEAMRKDARKALDTLGVDIDEMLPVEGLPVGYKQFIEIAREIDKENVKLLVFDEPTAVLTEMEADLFLKAVEKLSASGIAILFITHRLSEVMQVADNITVIRDGEVVGRLTREEATIEDMARMMVGRKIDRIEKAKKIHNGSQENILEIRNLRVDMPGELVKNVNLDVKKGEILGIGGLAGHGKIGIANGIMGLYRASGQVTFKGEKIKLNNPKDALLRGMAFVSEDRRGIGLLLDESIEKNIVLTAMQVQGKFLTKFFAGVNFADSGKIRGHATKLIEELDIRCTGPEQLVRRLSGGNQQKVCIARAITLEPDLLFVSEPTRGIDVGAKKIVLDLLLKLNQELGMTIVMTSSELAELRSICDRIAIIYDGKLEGILPPDADDTDFGLMMAGGHSDKAKEVS